MPIDTISNPVPPLCRTCTYGVFDDLWGEWKCKKHDVTVYNAYIRTECEDYNIKKEKPKAGV